MVEGGKETRLITAAGVVSTPNYGAHGHRQDSCDDLLLKETAATSTADTTMLLLLLLQLYYS
jgi:hypothetical protein